MNNLEGNKIIAEFMGLSFLGQGYDMYSEPLFNFLFEDVESDCPHQSHVYRPENLKFHSSWDWLMPVVEKIGTLGYRIHMSQSYGYQVIDFYTMIKAARNVAQSTKKITCSSYFKHSQLTEEQKESGVWFTCLIETTYKAVIEFIQWYNLNKGK